MSALVTALEDNKAVIQAAIKKKIYSVRNQLCGTNRKKKYPFSFINTPDKYIFKINYSKMYFYQSRGELKDSKMRNSFYKQFWFWG